ncbi:unnamed protein product [Prorocentrum cordatum]|uniref:Phosphatidylinositol-3-phosphatase n=1 Tax=Prorocentrum cordatum TaxID=2364126 RepID=A0ABN9S005_9DINO|nr:unnamed protein product [Polarella glacialis]
MKFASPDCQELTICDARPFVNAEANRFKGGGTEDSNYAGCHVEFLNVDNIHEMAKSLANFRKGMSQQEDHASCASAVSGWLGHLGAVIKGAGFAASVMESGESVVVHCSDGWDRTSQIVCLTSLLLDGHYRTIQGFPDLIVKDWLLPGHRFAHRNGLAARKEQRSHQDALSPIFLQFVDCVAQVWTVYPHFFQYSIQLLAFVAAAGHSYSGRYSTFLGNCQGEREQLRADRGPCLWTELLSDQGRWKNPLYDPRTARACIVPCVVPPRRLAFCAELYSSLGGLFAEDVDVGSWARRASRQASLLADFTPCRRPSRPAACSSGARRPAGAGWRPCRARTGEPSTLLTIAESALRRFLCVDDSFAQAPTVSVADCAEHSDHTEFVIAVRAAGRTLEVRRRFSEFDKLAHDLQAAGMAFTEPFPRKTLGRCRGGSLVQRRQRLDSWLLAVLAEARALEA